MRSVLLFSFLTFCFVGYGQIINFPDANFKNALVNSKCVDTNGDGWGDTDADLNDDGEIDVSEALKVLNLYVWNRNIYSLDGIGNFINLKDLDCSQNLTLNTLTLSNLPKLATLSCISSGLTTLDVKDLPSLTIIKASNNTTTLSNLALSNLPKLYTLDLSNSRLTSLDLMDFPSLVNINVPLNMTLTTLTLSNLPRLSTLDISNASLTSLNLKDFPSLSSINAIGNRTLSLSLIHI